MMTSTNPYGDRKAKVKERSGKTVDKRTYRALLLNQLPEISFQIANTRSLHVAGHLPESIIEKTLGVPEGLIDYCASDLCFLERESMFLKEIYKRSNMTYSYTSEADIQDGIKNLLLDIVSLGAWDDDVIIHQETFVPHAKYLGIDKGSHSDLWLIITNDNRPILVVEVKSPHAKRDERDPEDDEGQYILEVAEENDKNILDKKRVCGQIVDYMLDVASFHGQRNVYGVTTSGEYFKFHWLPQCDDDASSTAPLVDRSQEILEEAQPLLKRELYCTDTMHHTDPRVVPYLLTVLAKSLFSPRFTVPLISETRVYIRLLESTWEWNTLGRKVSEMTGLSLHVDHNLSRSCQFTVLRAFCRNKNQLVWLAFAGDTPRIVVLKQFTSEALARRELKVWKIVNEQEHARVLTVRRLPTLLMPLVLTVKESSGSPQLDGDLFNYLYSIPPSADDDASIPVHLRELREAILKSICDQRYDQLDILLDEAVHGMARHNIVHTDLRWCHFGVLPAFNNQGGFERVKAVMIDFSKIVENFDGDAVAKMKRAMADDLRRLV